jgi:hypothetical protein
MMNDEIEEHEFATGGYRTQAYFCLRACLFRFRIFFFRHFQRCLPRFFHARELLFMNNLFEFDDDPNHKRTRGDSNPGHLA